MVLTRSQKNRVERIRMERVFKKHKIREFRINLVRMNVTKNVEFRNSLFRQYGIRDCYVDICYLNEDKVRKYSSKKTLLAPKIGTIRSNVSWLPTSALAQTNSAEALSTLAAHQKRDGILPLRKNNPKKVAAMRHQRSLSLYAEPAPKNTDKKKATIEDLHIEFFEKCNSPNRGLKPGHQRKLPVAEPEPKSDFQKLQEQLKAKIRSKNAKQN